MRGPRVAIVEDEAIIALHIAHALQAAGCAVLGCASSAAGAMRQVATACLAETPPDVVLLDIQLKDMPDGISTAAVLREICGEGLAVVFVTGFCDPETRRRAEALRPRAIYHKPFDISALVASVLEANDSGQAAA